MEYYRMLLTSLVWHHILFLTFFSIALQLLLLNWWSSWVCRHTQSQQEELYGGVWPVQNSRKSSGTSQERFSPLECFYTDMHFKVWHFTLLLEKYKLHLTVNAEEGKGCRLQCWTFSNITEHAPCQSGVLTLPWLKRYLLHHQVGWTELCWPILFYR